MLGCRPNRNLRESFNFSDYRCRINSIFRQQFLRLARMWQLPDSQFMDLDSIRAQFARHRITQPALGIMVFHCQNQIIRFLGGCFDDIFGQTV